jgi:O-methyltransferase
MLGQLKSACKSLLFQLGYEIRSVSNPEAEEVDFKAALTVKESQYYSQWSAPCPLFSPWLGHPDFQAVYRGAEPHTLVSPDRCYVLIGLARYARHLSGDFAECGVWNGGTALLLARTLKTIANKKLYLFDSFQGLPPLNGAKDPWFLQGQYCAKSVEGVKALLSDFESMIDMRCGWIPETFRGLEERRYAFAHIDVDIYQSNLDCCAYFYPRLVAGGVLLFDEYCFAAARGEKEAVDEFFADKPERPIALPTGQALVLKVPSEKNRQSLTRKSDDREHSEDHFGREA